MAANCFPAISDQPRLARGDAGLGCRTLAILTSNCARAEREYSLLNKTLSTTIETVGTEYLYTDYVKDWASKKDVPLPILQIQD